MKKLLVSSLVMLILLTACTLPRPDAEPASEEVVEPVADAPTNTPETAAVPTDTPASEATAEPEATATVEATLSPDVFFDTIAYATEFKDLTGWTWFPWWKSDVYGYAGSDFIAKLENYRSEIVQGDQYRIQIPKRYTNFAAILESDVGSPDVRIITTAELSSPHRWTYIGVICRYSPVGWYDLFIFMEGYWGIMKVSYVDGTFFDVEMLVYEKTDALSVIELNQINVLDATCQGDTLSLTANSKFLGAVQDDTFAQGGVGVSVAAGDEGNSLVDFENFSVSTP